jgi:hypothetical protein
MTSIVENHDATFETLARLHRQLGTLDVGIDMKSLLPLLQTASIAASRVVTAAANPLIVPSEAAKERMAEVDLCEKEADALEKDMGFKRRKSPRNL